jgi:hypothetical protein
MRLSLVLGVIYFLSELLLIRLRQSATARQAGM